MHKIIVFCVIGIILPHVAFAQFSPDTSLYPRPPGNTLQERPQVQTVYVYEQQQAIVPSNPRNGMAGVFMNAPRGKPYCVPYRTSGNLPICE